MCVCVRERERERERERKMVVERGRESWVTGEGEIHFEIKLGERETEREREINLHFLPLPDDKVFTSSSRSRRLSSTASLSLDEQVSNCSRLINSSYDVCVYTTVYFTHLLTIITPLYGRCYVSLLFGVRS